MSSVGTHPFQLNFRSIGSPSESTYDNSNNFFWVCGSYDFFPRPLIWFLNLIW